MDRLWQQGAAEESSPGQSSEVAKEARLATTRDMRRRADAIERICSKHGLRMTGPRRVIARVLSETRDHPDVSEFHRRIAAVDSRISLATVYRTMRLFQTKGIVERHDFGDGRDRYETVAQAHHDHLINLQTGDVIEFRSDEIEQLQEKIARELGFKIVNHRLEIYAVPLNKKGTADR